jgi:hypothetical protein
VAQRPSGYERERDDTYITPPEPVIALRPLLSNISYAWDPCAAGEGQLVAILKSLGVAVIGTRVDFFSLKAAPPAVDAIITNPPYGTGGREAVRFIEHALTLVPRVVMLLRVDFDSAATRVHIFRDEPRFAFKLVLLKRIRWFADGLSSPSENHCWFGWSETHRGPPRLLYPSASPAPAHQQAPTAMEEAHAPAQTV